MFYLLLLLPLPILIAISFYLNSRKLFARTGNKYLVSTLEGLGAYIIVSSILLEGFFVSPVLQVGVFLIGLIVIGLTENNINEKEPELDLQIETVKNLFVIFTSTILLFYVLLSVFRFQPFYLQFFYATIGVILFNVLARYMKKISSKLYEKFEFTYSKIVNFKAWYIYAILGALFISIAFFNMPKIALNKVINLNESKAYFSYPDGSNQLMNRYEAKEMLNLKINEKMDQHAFLNHVGDNLFIYANNTVVIYNLQMNKVMYTGPKQASGNGINIPLNNQENNETRLQFDCGGLTDCIEIDLIYEYGGVKYDNRETIFMFDDLAYDKTKTAIFTHQIMHLFENEKIDSRISTRTDKPFVGFDSSKTLVTDVDQFEGELEFLQLEDNGDSMNVKVYKVIERNIDVELPFYSHYRLGMLIFIFIIGFVPISNYDLYATESSFENKIKHK